MGPNIFSGLVNILGTRPYYAENADARLDIKRHDPDQERRRKEQQDEEEKIRFDTYDNAVVSVDALRVFLQNFLQSVLAESAASNKMPDSTPTSFTPPAEPNMSHPHAAPHAVEASRAAGVYKTAAKTARPRMEAPSATPQQIIDNDEIRTIYKLLNDTALLQQRGVEFLTIERGETFLLSLNAAVQKHLSA